METCPRCGKESPDNSLHCVHCGAKLASAAARTQFGMPVLSLPGAATGGDSAKDAGLGGLGTKGLGAKDAGLGGLRAKALGAKDAGLGGLGVKGLGAKGSGAEGKGTDPSPEDLARPAVSTEKKSNPLAGLGGLKGGRRPGSLLKGLPQFRGATQSPLTSGEFALGKPGSSGLGLYSAAKRSSLPPEAAPEQSDQPDPIAPEDPGPTMAMPGVSAADLAQSAGADVADSPDAAGVDAASVDAASVDANKAADDPGPTLAMPGVSAADLASGSGEAEKPATPSAPVVARPAPVQVSKPVRRTDEPSADSSVADSLDTDSSARTAAVSKPLSEAPLPVAMRGSERAHHPHERGVTQARTSPEGGGNGKWIVIGVLVLAAIGVAVWLMQG